MYRFILLFLMAWPLMGITQALLYNDGASVTVQMGANVYVEGGVHIANSGTIDNDGTIELEGDWTNDVAGGLNSSSTGTVHFLGTVQQSIGGTETTEFHNLTIDNAAGVVLNLDVSSGGMAGSGILDLSSGYLDLNMNTIGITNTAPGGIINSGGTYIISETVPPSYGSVDWIIGNSGLPFPYTIPFGTATTGSDNLGFTFVVMASGTGANGTVSVKTYPTDNANSPLPTGIPDFLNATGYNLSLSSTDRFWVVDMNNFTTEPFLDLTMGYQDSENDPANSITESNLVPYEWDASSMYWVVNSTGSAVNTVNNNIAGISGGNSSSFWTFLDDAVLLPVSLISFEVKPVNNTFIATEWLVEGEEEIDAYVLQRSVDGVDFSDITEMKATGSPLYGFDDMDVTHNQTYYYRLKWVHFDGSMGYSTVRTARLTASDVWYIGDFYPSPTTGGSFVDINAPVDSDLDIAVFNQLGQQVAAFVGKEVGKGPNTLSFDLSGLAHGSYLFRFQSDSWQEVRPVVKLR